MLRRLPDHIADALVRAATAEGRSAAAKDPDIRAEHDALAKDWRRLADSYQFVLALEQFLLDADARKRELPPPAAPEPLADQPDAQTEAGRLRSAG
jgi:hypothetical protein